MGIFALLFMRQVERQMVRDHVQLYLSMGLGSSEARRTATTLVKLAIKTSKNSGTYNMPINFGDLLLGQAPSTSPKVQSFIERGRVNLALKRVDGVDDEDIRWWWNRDDVDRRLMEADDLSNQLTAVSHLLAQGKSLDEAATIVKSTFPFFGEPTPDMDFDNDNRPLPPELRRRIIPWSLQQGNLDSLAREESENASFNAILRVLIRRGTI